MSGWQFTVSAGTETPREGLAPSHSFASVIGCWNDYVDTDWLLDDTKKQEVKKKILSPEVSGSKLASFACSKTVRLKQIFCRLAA